MICYGNGFRNWLDQRLGDKVASDCTFIGRISQEKEEITAACAFSGYTGEDGDVELSFAMDRKGGTQELLRAIFAYVFGQLKCARCTARVFADNTKSIRLVKKLGFKREGVLRNARNGRNQIIYGLLREEYVICPKTAHSG